MRLKDLMNKNILRLDKKSTIEDALIVFASNDTDVIIIDKNNGESFGVITKKDLIKIILEKKAFNYKVQNILCKDYVIINENVHINEIDTEKSIYIAINENKEYVGYMKAKDLNQVKELDLLYFKMESIIESSYDGIYITDGEANAIKINKAYERITGLNRDEMLGKNMRQLVDDKILSQSVTLKVLETKKVTTIEQEFRTGKKALVTGTPIYDKKNNIIMVVTNVRDITELYDLREQLKKNQELALKYYSAIEEMKLQLAKHEYIVAEDEKTLQLLEFSQRIAKVDTTVLLLGETGVGKEEIAKFIHRNSLRKDRPFVKINCGAIPSNLIESELFGYEKGAFTGALQQGKLGMFEVAEGGTLLLDEIGELPLKMQVKLLRALQEQEITRVGGTKSIKIDVRILAATNRNLEKMVREKIFREDLYYRLNVVPVNIPPLREREKDILPLAYLFLEQFNKKYGLKKRFSFSTNACFLDYSWPGNIRELKNIVERVVVTSKENEISIEDLPEGICKNKIEKIGERDSDIIPLKDALGKIEKELIDKAYEKFGSVRSAAKALGIDASTFVRKRQKYEK